MITIVTIHLSIFFGNIGMYIWLRKKEENYFSEFAGGNFEEKWQIVAGSIIPIMDIVVLYGLTKDITQKNKSAIKQKKEKEQKEKLRTENPHLNAIFTLGELMERYNKKNGTYELRPSSLFKYDCKMKDYNRGRTVFEFDWTMKHYYQKAVQHKENTVMKYVLEKYEDSLVKLNAILANADSLSEMRKDDVYKDGQELLKKLFNEIEKFEKGIDLIKEETENKTYKQMAEKIQNEIKRHPDNYLTNEMRSAIHLVKSAGNN